MAGTVAANTLRENQVAAALLAALKARHQVEPPTLQPAGLDLAEAYRVAAAVRQLREGLGARVAGRKIGFTNTTMWDEYGVHAPIWGYVYTDTLHRLRAGVGPFDLSALVEPRIEPEIAFGLARSPAPDMDERALVDCIEWVAHGFEIVQSLFPVWRFGAADAVAAFGLHGALLLGERVTVTRADRDGWHEQLGSFSVALVRDGVVADRGCATNVLGGGPLAALRHLVGVLAADEDSPPLAPGEVITTGTLTKALPVAAGQTWRTELDGLALRGISIAF